MVTQVIFDTLTPLNGGTPGTAPAIFSATTDQTLAVITTAGAVEDLVANGTLKTKDIIYVNYDMDGTPGQTQLTVTSTSNGSLVNYGLISSQITRGKYSNPGGANPVTITNAASSTTSNIFAVLEAHANPESVLDVIPGNGSFTVGFTGDPGVSVISYIIVNG